MTVSDINAVNLAVNPALKAVGNTQQTANSAADKSQDFGAVLDKTAQKYEQKSGKPVQAASDSSTKSQTQSSDDRTSVGAQTEDAVEDTVETTSDTEAAVVEETAITEETAGELCRRSSKGGGAGR